MSEWTDALPVAIAAVSYVVTRLWLRWLVRPPTDVETAARDVAQVVREAADTTAQIRLGEGRP